MVNRVRTLLPLVGRVCVTIIVSVALVRPVLPVLSWLFIFVVTGGHSGDEPMALSPLVLFGSVGVLVWIAAREVRSVRRWPSPRDGGSEKTNQIRITEAIECAGTAIGLLACIVLNDVLVAWGQLALVVLSLCQLCPLPYYALAVAAGAAAAFLGLQLGRLAGRCVEKAANWLMHRFSF